MLRGKDKEDIVENWGNNEGGGVISKHSTIDRNNLKMREGRDSECLIHKFLEMTNDDGFAQYVQ